MKIKQIISTAAVIACICSFGSTATFAQKKDKNATNENAIVPQVNPLIIEVETFEGHSLNGDRNFIGIVGNTVQGKITNVKGMDRTGRLSGRDALIFNKCEAEIGEPTVNRKGTNYSFDVHVDDVLFFNSNPNTDWLLSITVYNDGKVGIDISSDSIGRIYGGQRNWVFMGHVNRERTQSIKKIIEDNPSLLPEEL